VKTFLGFFVLRDFDMIFMTFKTAGRQQQAGLARQMKSHLKPRHVFSSDLPSQDTFSPCDGKNGKILPFCCPCARPALK
jgi:hypothetical protein